MKTSYSELYVIRPVSSLPPFSRLLSSLPPAPLSLSTGWLWVSTSLDVSAVGGGFSGDNLVMQVRYLVMSIYDYSRISLGVILLYVCFNQ